MYPSLKLSLILSLLIGFLLSFSVIYPFSSDITFAALLASVIPPFLTALIIFVLLKNDERRMSNIIKLVFISAIIVYLSTRSGHGLGRNIFEIIYKVFVSMGLPGLVLLIINMFQAWLKKDSWL